MYRTSFILMTGFCASVVSGAAATADTPGANFIHIVDNFDRRARL